MLIPCPFCGKRGVHEFRYRGDASPTRPDPDTADAEAAFADYVYFRDNPAGAIRELWFHAMGCRLWLVVERDTRTHHISSVTAAAPLLREYAQ